ncbi:aspartic peptidase domain-containing protein [Lipomyces oligophaga]|uniref:aspartic peptidase domain-containing protein n=1 Tax=Lipomyces oligophaga TaxID=45792 RepID=UPI0034CF2601
MSRKKLLCVLLPLLISTVTELASAISLPLQPASGLYDGGVFTVEIGLGTPIQKQTLLVDTGSGSTLVFSAASNQCRVSNYGCGGGYNPVASMTSERKIGRSRKMEMGQVTFGFANVSATASGTVVRDIVYLERPELVEFAMLEHALLDFDVEGVLGLGMSTAQTQHHPTPILSTLSTLNHNGRTEYRNLFGLYFGSRRKNGLDSLDGQVFIPSLDLGVIDSEKLLSHDDLHFIPCSSPNEFQLVLSNIDLILANKARVPILNSCSRSSHSCSQSVPDVDPLSVTIDSGSPNIVLPDHIAHRLATAISPSAIFDGSLPGFRVPCTLSLSLNSVEFSFMPTSASVAVNVTVAVPELLRSLANSPATCLLDIVPSSAYNNLVPAILGTAFLSSAYTIFDLDSHQIAFAVPPYYPVAYPHLSA